MVSIHLSLWSDHKVKMVKSNYVTTWFRDISSWPNELCDKMHFVTSVCVKRYVDRYEHMSRSYNSKSRSYRLSRTCAGHEPICREHPTPQFYRIIKFRTLTAKIWKRSPALTIFRKICRNFSKVKKIGRKGSTSAWL